MPTMPDFLVLLQTLAEHQVDFIVVGGVSAVLQGVPITTFDLDLVHSRAPDNLNRLLTALEATYRERKTRKFAPGLSHLASPGHQLLMTRAGPLDLLGTIGAGHSYEDLVPHTLEVQVGGGFAVRLLDLKTLIAVKEETARD